MSNDWYFVRDGESVGPVSLHEVVQALRQSAYWRGELVWKSGMRAWVQAGAVGEIAAQMERDDAAPAKTGGAFWLYPLLALAGIVAGVAVFFIARLFA